MTRSNNHDVLEQIAVLAPQIPAHPQGLLVSWAAVERGMRSEPVRPVRSLSVRRWRVVTVAGAAVVALALAGVAVSVMTPRSAPGTSGGTASFTSFTDARQLAQASEHLVRGTVLDEPSYGEIAPGNVTHYAVVHLVVTDVVGSRPDAPVRITKGDTIVVGFNVLDPAQRRVGADDGELADEVFPSEGQVPDTGTDILGFLVSTTLGSAGKGYEAVGSLTIDLAENTATFTTVPGALNNTTVTLSALMGDSFVALYDSPSPWKAGSK